MLGVRLGFKYASLCTQYSKGKLMDNLISENLSLKSTKQDGGYFETLLLSLTSIKKVIQRSSKEYF